MTKQELLKEIDELIELNGKPYSFFLSWKEYDNVKCHEHGKFDMLDKYIEKMEKSSTCIQGILPFDFLCIYFNCVVVVFKLDKNWDCVNDLSCESHDIYAVPFINSNGDWLYLNGSPKTEYQK